MKSETLQKARDFEANTGRIFRMRNVRPFHATPTIGWMNDLTAFPFTRENITCFISIIPIPMNGDRCIGAI